MEKSRRARYGEIIGNFTWSFRNFFKLFYFKYRLNKYIIQNIIASYYFSYLFDSDPSSVSALKKCFVFFLNSTISYIFIRRRSAMSRKYREWGSISHFSIFNDVSTTHSQVILQNCAVMLVDSF